MSKWVIKTVEISFAEDRCVESVVFTLEEQETSFRRFKVWLSYFYFFKDATPEEVTQLLAQRIRHEEEAIALETELEALYIGKEIQP